MARNVIPKEHDVASLGSITNRWKEVVTKGLVVGNSNPIYEDVKDKDGKVIGKTPTGELEAIKLTGDIIVDEGSKYSIGEADKKLKAVYADEVYISQHTLYIDGKPVLNSDNETIQIKTDKNQGISISTTGTGDTKITSEQAIIAKSEGANAHVDFTAVGSNSAINFSANKLNITGAVEINTSAKITNLTVTGQETSIQTTDLTVTDDAIVINAGGKYIGAGENGEKRAGILIDRGTGKAGYHIDFYETDKTLKIGLDGEEQTVITEDVLTSKGYLTETALNTKLNSYISESALNTRLNSYITQSSLTTTLQHYATTETTTSLDTKIDDLETTINSSITTKISKLETTINSNISTQIETMKTEIETMKAQIEALQKALLMEVDKTDVKNIMFVDTPTT